MSKKLLPYLKIAVCWSERKKVSSLYYCFRKLQFILPSYIFFSLPELGITSFFSGCWWREKRNTQPVVKIIFSSDSLIWTTLSFSHKFSALMALPQDEWALREQFVRQFIRKLISKGSRKVVVYAANITIDRSTMFKFSANGEREEVEFELCGYH